jgi:hypothetical protein
MFMFTVLAYRSSVTLPLTNAKLNAVTDSQFPTRNNNFIFTEPYKLLQGQTNINGVTDARYDIASWSVYGPNSFYLPAGGLSPAISAVGDFRFEHPTPLPLNEEIGIRFDSPSIGGPLDAYGFLWIGTPNHNRLLPKGIHRMVIPQTFAGTTLAVATWSTPIPLSLPPQLRGGVYSILGATFVNANASHFRFIFQEGPQYQGRRLRPGDWVWFAGGIGFILNQPYFQNYWGEWGRFHTFNPPSIEFLGFNAGASGAITGWVDLLYMGIDKSLINQQQAP